MEKVTLFDNPWLTLNKVVDPENGVNGYVYSHEKRCNGKIVSILPYRKKDGKYEYLLRKEITPCWSMDYRISSITGGVEKDDPIETAIHEIKEEAGYSVEIKELISLGICRGTKSSDTEYHLFGVDLTDKIKGEATGDGSELEKNASCFWSDSFVDVEDPLVFTAWYKLVGQININID